MNLTSTPTGRLVDMAGEAKAAKADADNLLAAIKATLFDREGLSQPEGELFRAVLSLRAAPRKVNYEAALLEVLKKTDMSERAIENLLNRHTSEGNGTLTLSVYARRGNGKAAE